MVEMEVPMDFPKHLDKDNMARPRDMQEFAKEICKMLGIELSRCGSIHLNVDPGGPCTAIVALYIMKQDVPTLTTLIKQLELKKEERSEPNEFRQP